MNKKTWWIITIVVIIIIIFGIIYMNNNQKKQDTIKIGGAFALTGFASVWGEDDRNGVLMAIEEVNKNGGVNGKQVELIVEDTKSSNQDSLSAALKLVEVDNVDVIVGPTWSDTFLSAIPLSEEKNIVMMEPSGSITALQSTKIYKNIFSTWYRSDSELKEFPKYLKKENITSIVIIISQDVFWEDSIKNLKIGIQNQNISIIKEFKVNPEEKDLRSVITQAKNLKPQAIFFGFDSEKNLLAFIKQRKEIYPDSILFTTESISEFINNNEIKSLLEGIKFVSPETMNQKFNKRYYERFNKQPVFSASNSYDATKILIEAIKNTNSTSTDKIREYLKNNEFDTVTFGKTRFDTINGVIGGKFMMKIIENESIEDLEKI